MRFTHISIFFISRYLIRNRRRKYRTEADDHIFTASNGLAGVKNHATLKCSPRTDAINDLHRSRPTLAVAIFNSNEIRITELLKRANR